MKNTLSLVLLATLTSFSQAQAAPVTIADYDWKVTDVADVGLTKESIFKNMERSFIKLGSSICANRALMWLYDFKTQYEIDGAKVFMFYTPKTGGEGLKTWWYHVAPIIAEKNELFVMDAGFSNIKGPLKVKDWIGTFSVGANCKEIQASETDLIELMNSGRQFPTTTRYGTYDCYYKVVPAGLWFPATVAASLTGEKIPNEIKPKEVYSACLEAATSPLGSLLGSGKRKCKKYLGI